MVQFQAVDRTLAAAFASHFLGGLRLQPLRWTLLLQVVFQEQVLHSVDRSCSLLAHPLPHGRQLAVFRIALPKAEPPGGRSGPSCRPAVGGGWSTTVPPGRSRRGGRSCSCFVSPAARAPISRQPYSVKSFKNQSLKPQTSTIVINPPSGYAPISHVFEKFPHTLPFRANLTFEDHVSAFVTKIYGQLLAVLVDGKVQHIGFSCLCFW